VGQRRRAAVAAHSLEVEVGSWSRTYLSCERPNVQVPDFEVIDSALSLSLVVLLKCELLEAFKDYDTFVEGAA
jgi:hypothetical protein